MRCLLFATALLLVPALVQADEKARPNTLTPKEIADGWILLFDGETTFGWKVAGDAAAASGLLILGEKKASTVTTTTELGNGELRFQVRWAGPTNAEVVVGTSKQKLAPLAQRELKAWHRCKVTIDTNSIAKFEISSPSRGMGEGKTGGLHGKSRVHVAFHVPVGGKIFLRNITYKPADLKPIFNGKDLTGWKPIKGKGNKSKFTVTARGELNIKDGRGDIQTTGQWDDFALQIEVFSNGKHLNSGVFFRCLPGQFWSGYEAQIRNQWEGKDRTKPVDYGTGGIYNRQPARKVVSSDNEWFTMTIVATGNHLAVWVNGYQTADFTDPRKPNKSARNGSKVDKGPISLQGHDKTTDLSFRNIRIAAIPRATDPKK